MLIKLLDLCLGGERGGRVVIVLCPWVGLLTLTFPFSAWVYNLVPAKYLGLTLRWTSIPFGGEGRGGEEDRSSSYHFLLLMPK